ncbi:histidine phosphatase family protein [Cellulomonas sp. KRMCY2]|uniref:NUDIX hydrolase n=1 Tax=Cellulomonas sp. KRMCY2 TaxID=1304865 RepID=UPI00045E8BEC|nr:histidine phosphatase family protein [Cellulomonas sp. KRMCY2]
MLATHEGTSLGVVHAAGAVVWREQSGRLEVALVHRPRYQDWSWPKGKLDPGEGVAAAAVREVAEEIGVPVVLGVPLPGLRYRTPDGRGKAVRYWSARIAEERDAVAVEARGTVRPAELTEIDDVVWVSTSTAADLLTRRTDRAPLKVVESLWAADRLRTRVLAVVRHGQARPRARWSGGEASRPLTPLGRAQSEALVPALAAFGVREIVTSPWDRCVRTVEPYASATGLPVTTLEALTESAHASDRATVVAVLTDHLAHARDVLVSTHRPVLGTVLDVIGESTRRWTVGVLPTADPYLRTGEVLVAHVAGAGRSARVVALEHHRPPHV